MLPKLVSMRDEYPNTHFVKVLSYIGACKTISLICVSIFLQIMMTSASKELGQRLNIRVAPSFLFYHQGEQVAFVTGTKEQELRQVLDAHQ